MVSKRKATNLFKLCYGIVEMYALPIKLRSHLYELPFCSISAPLQRLSKTHSIFVSLLTSVSCKADYGSAVIRKLQHWFGMS